MTDDITEDNRRAYIGLEALAGLTNGVAAHAPQDEDRRPFLVAWGLLAAMQRQALAVALLHRKGFGHEAAPNRRALIEHLAQIRWIAEDGADAVDSMNKALQASQGKLRNAADAAGMSYEPTIPDAVQSAVIPSNSANQYNNFTPLLKRLSAPLLATWIGATQLAHPTLTGAQCFFDDTADDQVLIYDEPTYRGADNPVEQSPYAAFTFMWAAMDAFNQLMKGSPWGDELQRIASEGGLTDHSEPRRGEDQATGDNGV
ncbi:hypothetical protein OG912_38060 (plasmid) [Streptomyces sp. NBC_00464]|uniref:hypothetical protein n=1 Tax=Streptomyces sp. NBC_00464 TaxID=2975751 RepID=UPI002E19253A